MPLCPNQHKSHAADFCEVCGVEIPSNEEGATVAAAPVRGEPVICPACHAEHEASVGDFCEVCGYNFKTGSRPAGEPAAPPPPEPAPPTAAPVNGSAPPASASSNAAPMPEPLPADASPTPGPAWELVVAVERNPHADMPDEAGQPAFAGHVQELAARSVLVGRRSVRRNILPEISLDHDDGVSHRHAQLTRTADGCYELSDLGSSNGTVLNGTELPPGAAVTLKEGDAISLGRWTRLTFRRSGPAAAFPDEPPSPASSSEPPHSA